MYCPNGTRTEIYDYNKLQDTFVVPFYKLGKNKNQQDHRHKVDQSSNSLQNIAVKGFISIAFFANSVIGSFSTVCVSALTPNAVDNITSMVRL